jgi:1,6-anhydro-N-acetylmuramate kinase
LKCSATFLDGELHQTGCAVKRCPGRRIFSHLSQRGPHNERRTEKALKQGIVQLACDSRALKTPFFAKIELSLALLSIKPAKPSLKWSRRTRDRIQIAGNFVNPRVRDLLDGAIHGFNPPV